jgi:ATP-dependent Clp protease adapter protein ClpS
MGNTQQEILEEIITSDDVINSCKVILFNDDWHTFDEVIAQLMKATGISYQKAEALTLEVHEKGKACVYDGELSECLRVSSILEEIALYTQIEY